MMIWMCGGVTSCSAPARAARASGPRARLGRVGDGTFELGGEPDDALDEPGVGCALTPTEAQVVLQAGADVPAGEDAVGGGREVEHGVAARGADALEQALERAAVLRRRSVVLTRVEMKDGRAGVPGGEGLLDDLLARDWQVRAPLRVGVG
jgi:hypothetical protein